VQTGSNNSIDTIYQNYVPGELRDFIYSRMGGWKLPQASDWQKRWWDEYKKDKTLVNYVSGDFNCDGKQDHSMILTDEKNNIGAWAFLANQNSFDTVKLDQFENPGNQIGAGLQILPKGKHAHLDMDNPNIKVEVKCEGITVIFFEKAARSYYFENGKLRWIQTAD
jgi:hypothetical protein